MKNKHYENDNQETKNLLKDKQILDKFYDPLFFSRGFSSGIKTINIFYLSYVVSTTILFIIIHYYGKLIIQGKATRLEYDNLLYYNLFNNFYFILAIIPGFLSISRKSLKYFLIFYMMTIIYSTFFIIYYFARSHFKTSFEILYKNENFAYFNLLVFLVNTCIFVYSLFYFISLINKNRKMLNDNSPTSMIMHEICLRTDMMKIGFNHFVIRTKLNKMLPNILFKKDSYYYSSLRMDNDKSEYRDQEKLHIEHPKRGSEYLDSTLFRTSATNMSY